MVVVTTDKNNNGIAEFDNQVKIQEYAEAYQLYDLMHGRSHGREWKSSVFFVIALIMFFILSMEHFNLVKVPAATIVLLISSYMCTHYLYLLPRKAKLLGEHIYKSSHLLSKSCHFKIERDNFTLKNDYEYIKKYNTDITDCIETDEMFVLMGGIDKKIVVISKRCLDEQQYEVLSHHFQARMVKQYRRTKQLRGK